MKKFILLLTLMPFLAHAHSLLIISSGAGMYGDDAMNYAMESFGANLVEAGLKNDYQKIYRFEAWKSGLKDSNDKSREMLLRLLKDIVSQRAEGERLDVF